MENGLHMNWDAQEAEATEGDLTERRAELRREMCGGRVPSDHLDLAIYEAVLANASATSEDVFETYLKLAADVEASESAERKAA